eukprot:141442_1
MPDVDDFCVDNRDVTIVFLSYTFPILSILAVLSIITALHAYIKANIKGDLTVSKPLFYAGMIFFIACCAAIMTFFGSVLSFCGNKNIYRLHHVFAVTAAQLYALQTILLIGILFYRLFSIFKNTSFAFTKRTSISFLSVYTVTMAMLIFASFMWSNMHSISSLSSIVTGVLTIVLLVFLNSLFINKLMNVHKMCDQNNDGLIKIITKTSLLSFVSTFISLLCFTFIALAPMIDSIYWDFTRNLVILADEYTNFACIFLSYAYFKEYYAKICGGCDKNCGQLWAKCILRNDFNIVDATVDVNENEEDDCGGRIIVLK